MRLSTAAVVLGFLLDLAIGDPHWLYHPVRLIGGMISWLEKGIRALMPKSKGGELTGGVLLALLMITFWYFVPWRILSLLYAWKPAVGFGVEIIFCYQLLATRALKDESMKVYQELKKGDLEGGRRAVSMIVGRDTAQLSAEGVTKAAVETVAENTSDGIIAPMLFMFLGGAPLGFFYKAINTMDSMVGYKNDKYLYFGRFAAKLDDVVNYIPARISALLMVVTAFLSGMDGKNAWKIYRRDHANHSSPNSAQTESVAAGALDIELAGNAYYFGKLYEKPTIGDPIRKIEIEDIRSVNGLLYGTAILSMVVFVALTTILFR